MELKVVVLVYQYSSCEEKSEGSRGLYGRFLSV